MIAEIILKVAGFDRFNGQVPYYPRPSYAGPEKCLRSICYEAQGYPKKLSDRFYAILDDSSWHEELTLDILRRSSFKVHSEQMVVECGMVTHKGAPFMIKGRIDGILTDLLGVDRLFEHKAVNHFSFERYSSEEFPMDYLTQMAFYFVGLSKVQPEIHEGILLIKNKNTAQYLEFFLEYDISKDLLKVEVIRSDGMRREGGVFSGLYGHGIERFEEVERHRKNKTLPPRQYGPGDWQCSYCSFEEMCNASTEKEFASLSQENVCLKEIESAVEKYIELSNLKKETEKRIEGLKEEIKSVMKSAGTRKASVNGFIVSLALQKRNTLDKSLIPSEILRGAQKESVVEVLTVKHGT